MLVLTAQLPLQQLDLEVVLDPQQHLGEIEGLAQKVARSGTKRPKLCLRGVIGGQDDDRKPQLPPVQLADHLYAVWRRHVQVEQQEVGRLLGAEWDGL